jgi:hypothetical protein
MLLAIIAGLVMWESLLLHQGCCSAREAMELSVLQEEETVPVSSVLGNDMADSSAAHMYTGAYQVSVHLAHLSAQHEPDTPVPAVVSIKGLLDQLTNTLHIAQRVVYMERTTHNNVPHTQLSQPLSKVWHYGFQVLGLCDWLFQLSLQDLYRGGPHVSWNSLISVATAVSARINNPDLHHPLPPALRHDGSHPTNPRDDSAHEQGHSNGLLQWQIERLQTSDLPSPVSILHAYPPPPPDLQQWDTFYHDSCPVTLGKQTSTDARPWFERVTLPSPPQVGATREQVEAYVAETEAQLGASFYALAPVPAAIGHRPKPWVSNTF